MLPLYCEDLIQLNFFLENNEENLVELASVEELVQFVESENSVTGNSIFSEIEIVRSEVSTREVGNSPIRFSVEENSMATSGCRMATKMIEVAGEKIQNYIYFFFLFFYSCQCKGKKIF